MAPLLGTYCYVFLGRMTLLQFYDLVEQSVIDTYWLYHALATPPIKKTPLGRLAARKISTRSNPNIESLQKKIDPESLIRTANKLKRLVPFSLY